MSNPEVGNSVDVGGIHTNYIEAGTENPDALVLIHGSGPGVTAFANWNGVIPAFSEHFHVYAPDMVGFGYTECPAEITDFTLDLWVSHIVAFMDAVGIAKARFVGNSYGGALSLAVASRYPERVEKFVLMGAAGIQFEMSEGLRQVWGYEPSPENMRKLMETFAYDPSLVKDEIVQSRHEASIRAGSHENFSRLFPKPHQDRLDGLATPEDDIRAIAVPALIVHGREDRIVPVDVAYRYSALIKNSELHVFGNCGHWTQIEKRDRFIGIVLGFLAD